MVDILESVSLEAVRALARCSTLARLEARDVVLVAPTSTQRGCFCL
jgi:hypothetical protein